GTDVAEVDLRPQVLDEPDLLVALRRLEDQAMEVDLVEDLVDQPGAGLAVAPVETGVARRASLADDLGGNGVARLLDLLEPEVRRKDRVRILLADLGEDGEVLRQLAD